MCKLLSGSYIAGAASSAAGPRNQTDCTPPQHAHPHCRQGNAPHRLGTGCAASAWKKEGPGCYSDAGPGPGCAQGRATTCPPTLPPGSCGERLPTAARPLAIGVLEHKLAPAGARTGWVGGRVAAGGRAGPASEAAACKPLASSRSCVCCTHCPVQDCFSPRPAPRPLRHTMPAAPPGLPT